MFFLALAASLSWMVLAGDPGRVRRQPQTAQGTRASAPAGTGLWGCSAPSTLREGSRAPGHSHPGFHRKNNVSESIVTHHWMVQLNGGVPGWGTPMTAPKP